MSLTIDQIEKQLTAGLNQGHLAISSALLDEIRLGAFPRWLVPASDLALEAAALERRRNTHLQVVGRYAHPNFGAASLVIDVNWLNSEAPSADVQLSFTAPVRLRDFVAKAGLAASGAIAKLADAVAVAGVASRRFGDTCEIELSLAETLNIKIGPVEARLTLDKLVIGIDPLTWREASGTLSLSGYELPARLPLSGSFSLQLTPQNLSVLDLIRTTGIALPSLPDIPLLTKPLEGFVLEFAAEGVRLSGIAPAPPFGKLRFALAQAGGSYEAAIALEVESNLRFSSITSALKPLDALMSNVSFGSPAFVLSSVSAPAFPLPTAEGKPGPWPSPRARHSRAS